MDGHSFEENFAAFAGDIFEVGELFVGCDARFFDDNIFVSEQRLFRERIVQKIRQRDVNRVKIFIGEQFVVVVVGFLQVVLRRQIFNVFARRRRSQNRRVLKVELVERRQQVLDNHAAAQNSHSHKNRLPKINCRNFNIENRTAIEIFYSKC